MNVYPLVCTPVPIEKIWGGTTLHNLFPDKAFDSNTAIGESWELSVRDDVQTYVGNGEYAGRSIYSLIEEYGTELIGSNGMLDDGRFPLLLKFIDAAQPLSVQVHPDNEWALRREHDLGKTEAWYIISAEPESSLIVGTRPGTTQDDFKQALNKGNVETVLNKVSVSSGDVIFIPAGTLHAIGAGIVLFEIQQNSDVTYRAFDWNRKDVSGNSRELHIDNVLAVTDFNAVSQIFPQNNIQHNEYCVTRIACDVFVLDEVRIIHDTEITVSRENFMVLTILSGTGTIGESVYAAGTTIMIPAGWRGMCSPIEPTILLASYPHASVSWIGVN